MAHNTGDIVTMVERKIGITMMETVARNTVELVSREVIDGLSPYADYLKTLSSDNDKQFPDRIQID